jgi:hypothetical protein
MKENRGMVIWGGSDGFSWRAGVRRVFGMECLGWCSKFQEAVERARRRSSQEPAKETRIAWLISLFNWFSPFCQKRYCNFTAFLFPKRLLETEHFSA